MTKPGTYAAHMSPQRLACKHPAVLYERSVLTIAQELVLCQSSLHDMQAVKHMTVRRMSLRFMLGSHIQSASVIRSMMHCSHIQPLTHLPLALSSMHIQQPGLSACSMIHASSQTALLTCADVPVSSLQLVLHWLVRRLW